MTFGQALPDGVPLVTAHVSHGLALLLEARELAKERAIMEREHAKNLDALYRKHAAKLDKKLRDLSLGPSPSPAAAAASAGNVSSAMTMWNDVLNNLDAVAKERAMLAERLVVEVADKLKLAAGQFDDTRKKHIAFHNKLAAEQEKMVQEKDKAKLKYLQACEDVESAKLRFERADEKNQEKLKKVWHQSIVEMNNAKNAYLLSIAMCNVGRKHHQKEQVPWILDELEELEVMRINAFKQIMQQLTVCETEALKACTEQFAALSGSITSVDARADTALFLSANQSAWHEVPEIHFEPTPLWRDTADLAVADDACRVVLANHRAKVKARQAELAAAISQDQSRIYGIQKMVDVYTESPSLGDPIYARDELLEHRRRLHLATASHKRHEAELLLIQSALGSSEDLSGKPHAFKPTSFTLPTPCGCCQNSIWGLARQGLVCRDCGFVCHTKCELKVPGACTGNAKDKDKSDTASIASSVVLPSSATAIAPISTLERNGSVYSTAESAANSATSPSLSILAAGIGGASSGGDGGWPTAIAGTPALPALDVPALDISVNLGQYSASASPIRGNSFVHSRSSTVENAPSRSSSTVAATSGDAAAVRGPPLTAPSPAAVAASNPDLSDAGDNSSGPVTSAKHDEDAADPTPAPAAAPASDLSRSASATSIPCLSSSSAAAASAPAPVATSDDTTPKQGSAGQAVAVALYDYAPAGDGELALVKGQVVAVASDAGEDGSGWISVRYRGEHGLVPASYVHVVRDDEVHLPHAQVVYPYTAQGEGEVDVGEGEVVRVLADEGDGWIQVQVTADDRVGLIPASYANVLTLLGQP
ncbi:Protein BZZ1 [Blastocladiella emersonii ATCC 22665]|nr:Protein BZZ1 [Blastocladiella emersonii ATCC 22665]